MSEVAHAAPTASEYIVHHLTHWQNKPQTEIVDFSVFNLDSLFFSITLGLLGSFFLWKAARKATSGVPGRFQAAVDCVCVDFPAQRHGFVAAGLVAYDLGLDLRRCRP